MTTQAQRLERLEMLQDMLERHDEIFGKDVKFDIRMWFTDDDNVRKDCGTAACALGSAACYPPFMTMGLNIQDWQGKKPGEEDFSARHSDVCYDGEEGCSAGAEFFGITRQESEWLFNPDEYLTKDGYNYTDQALPRFVKPKVVAHRVGVLIEYYSKTTAEYLNRRAGL